MSEDAKKAPVILYRGVVDAPLEWDVTIVTDGQTRRLDPRNDVRNHSPDGFSWGYGGSGPAQTALAILCDAIGIERAVELYQDFKWERIASLDMDIGWEMPQSEVLAWVATKATN